jgi:hypothetical protein
MRGFKSHISEGESPKPKSEYFIRPFTIKGKIVRLIPVFDVPVQGPQYRSNMRKARNPDEKTRIHQSMSVWRWRVRIQTDEGWMLMGYIGKTDRKEALPPIRVGDTVEVNDLILDTNTGGKNFTASGLWKSYSGVSDTKLDYRSRRFDRQLHGKVKR